MELLPLFLAALLKVCPPREDVAPCRCEGHGEESGVSVNCNRLRSITALRSSIRSLKGTSVYTFVISNLNAAVWPVDLFKDVAVEYLHLQNVDVRDSSFESGHQQFLVLGNSLNGLAMFGNSAKKKSLKLRLDHLSNLETLHFNDYSIPKLGDEWFSTGLGKLSTLYLTHDNIEELGQNAFRKLSSLKSLNLMGNNIRDIRRSMLPEQRNRLSVLILSENKLRNIPSDTFTGFPLEHLYLDKNLLHSLDERTFLDILENLQIFQFSGNQIQCNDELVWICDAPGRLQISGDCIKPKEKTLINILSYCKTAYIY